MTITSVSQWSTTPSDNTDLDGVSIAEGVAVISGMNNAIRNLMAQMASAIANGELVTGLPFTVADSSTSTYFDFLEDTDNGTNYARLIGPALLGSNVTVTLPDTTGTLALTSNTTSTTEVLTGTNTAKFATADGIAALWEKGSSVASAATVSLGEGGFFHVTGTTTITDIDFATAKDGRGAWLEFDGALTLTHNATTLALPGGANITTAAGDRCYVVQDSSDNVHVLAYQKADGTAVVASAAGQPIPTSSTFAVGTLAFMYYTSGSNIANGATVAGSSLASAYWSGTTISSNGGTQSGTWTNRSGGSIPATAAGLFARTA